MVDMSCCMEEWYTCDVSDWGGDSHFLQAGCRCSLLQRDLNIDCSFLCFSGLKLKLYSPLGTMAEPVGGQSWPLPT